MNRYLFLLLLFTLSACMGGPYYNVSVSNPNERIIENGFSFLPPKGKEWRTTGDPIKSTLNNQDFGPANEKSYHYMKAIFHTPATKNKPYAEETFHAKITITRFESYTFDNEAKLMKYTKSKYSYDSHPILVKSEFSSDSSHKAICSSISALIKHEGEPWAPNLVLMEEDEGFNCILPNDSKTIVSFRVKKVYAIGRNFTDVQDELNHFMESFQFN